MTRKKIRYHVAKLKKSAGRRRVSKTHDWCTPKVYVDAVKEFFGGSISLDPCSNMWSIVGADTEFMLPTPNGLKKEWNFPTIFVNPPYGSDIKRHTTIKNWLLKCADASERFGSEVIALVPVATNTSHWKEAVFGRAKAVCFLYETRVKFLEAGELAGRGAPMACCLIYWGTRHQEFIQSFMKYGATIDITALMGITIGESTPTTGNEKE